MAEDKLDRRLHAYRDDLASIALQNRVRAARYVDGELRHVRAAKVGVRREPRHDAPLETEALGNEMVRVFEDRDGWSWGQLQGDGYVGYLESDALARGPALAAHRISVPRTFVFPVPDIKSPPTGVRYLGASLIVDDGPGSFLTLNEGGYLYAPHVTTTKVLAGDYVDVALEFIGAPYLWGGKTADGIDCSGLVQVALTAAGIGCLRDSDMQLAALGQTPTDPTKLQRGDLIFWAGHVGMMIDQTRLLHANAFHMRVVSELLDEAVTRITASTGNNILDVRRLGDEIA